MPSPVPFQLEGIRDASSGGVGVGGGVLVWGCGREPTGGKTAGRTDKQLARLQERDAAASSMLGLSRALSWMESKSAI